MICFYEIKVQFSHIVIVISQSLPALNYSHGRTTRCMLSEMTGGCLIINMSLFLHFALFVKALSQGHYYPNGIDLTGSDCPLNFTQNPYQPTGQCINDNRIRDKLWGAFPTSLCCANALTTISKALALRIAHASSTNQTSSNIFLPQDQWNGCNGNFTRQPSVSLESCKLDNLYAGSAAACSKLDTTSLTNLPLCNTIRATCSGFQTLPYDDACVHCTHAIKECRNQLLSYNLVTETSDTKSEVCSLAIIILIAADKLQNNPSSFDDFYSCLPLLDEFDPGYIRINYSNFTTILTVLLVILGVVLVAVLVKYVSKRQARSQAWHKEDDPAWSGLYRFTKVEIENAVNFWGDKRYLGRGSAGLVYMGVLPSGQNVAIKHIFNTNHTNSFFSEVEGLSRIRHSNLVCLFGYCVEDDEQYLVYEYCSGGNLSQRLLRKDMVLSWYDRVKILRHCALALRFLHNNLDGCIVHRDIKLTNILLSDDLMPKLSDFGLAKLLKMEQSKVFTDVKGTIGYMDPEYMTNAKLTCASDIYSFGIVTLQLLSGQRVIELDLDARDQLTRKARDVSMGERPLTDFIDPRLEGGEVNESDFESILQIAVLCVASSSKGRPSIDMVFDEMNRAWKNSEGAKDGIKDGMHDPDQQSYAISDSRSLDVIPA